MGGIYVAFSSHFLPFCIVQQLQHTMVLSKPTNRQGLLLNRGETQSDFGVLKAALFYFRLCLFFSKIDIHIEYFYS